MARFKINNNIICTQSYIMKKFIFFLLFVTFKSYSQNCNDLNLSINSKYSYTNETHDFSLPFNEGWKIMLENQKAIIVSLTDPMQFASASVMLNQNGYPIPSAHSINDQMVRELANMVGSRIGNDFKILTTKKSYIKNIKVNIVEYEYLIKNLDDEYQMTGIMFQIVKKQNYTFVYMFNCLKSLRNCYVPFFTNVMKQAYFGQEWYSLN